MWGWLQEQRGREAQLAAGWSGAMSFPRTLELEDGRVVQRFVPELTALRGEPLPNRDLDVDGTVALPGVEGHELELRIVFERGTADRTGLALRHGPRDVTHLTLDWEAATLACDAPGCSADGRVRWSGHELDLEPGTDRVEMQVMLDRSTLEVLADGRGLTARMYPEPYGTGHVDLFAEGGTSRASVEAWRLAAPA